MNGRSFGSLFGPYLGGCEISSALASGQVENMDMDHSTGRMRCTISFDVLVPLAELQSVEAVLATNLRIQGVILRPQYTADMFNEACMPDLIAQLKKWNVAVNGTFEDATFEI